ISDLSKEMVEFCQKKFGTSDLVEYRILDAEEDVLPSQKYALICGSYTAQWFKYPSKSLSKIASSLKPGGLLLISFPASESFSNWKKNCLDLGIPYTGNSLPDLEQVIIELSMGAFKVDYYEDDMTDTFESVFDFFRHLKHTGTATNMADKQLTIKQLKLLNNYWLKQDDGQITVRYHTAFVAVKRDFE
ncbi:MAG: methyltransferase domain-containing protein, partial [Balneolaceae bacterium]|nr:methyltransferase domain-containing protein [Balneolaceae bacterium]